MSPLAAPILGGIIAMLGTLAVGYFLLRNAQQGKASDAWKNPLPVVGGAAAGFLVLALLVNTYSPDRFYSAEDALRILAGMTLACLVIWSVEISVPKMNAGLVTRTVAHVVSQIAASALVVWAGVKFDLMKVPGEGVTTLGEWSSVLTVAWLVLATNVVRLLDGIHGGASIALLIAGLAALYSNIVSKEFFLGGFSLVAVGCAIGSLRFCLSQKRLPLEGAGTALIGFFFATLTIMARQKTVATLLLLVPLVLIVLIAGAAMLGLLEKRLLLPRHGEQNPEESGETETGK
jgi:UDP-N-acetylmuramyl pentapeptide phosphotransferase/UDP-N-acetylglucosamine-1-phosphate transferase